MMFGQRYTVRGRLKVLSHLHIGGSDPTSITDSTGETSLLSPVAVGVDGPIIPASSLKGVLRHALALDEDDTHPLGYGTDKTQGHVARLWLDHATLDKTPEASTLVGLSETPSNGGRFYAKHMSQDPTTGAALDGHLWTSEMVAAGSVFAFSAEWLSDDLDELAKALAPLVMGVSVGAGTSKGAGRVELHDIKLTHHTPDGTGHLVAAEVAGPVLSDFLEVVDNAQTPRSATRIRLALRGNGPFISVRGQGAGSEENIAQPLEAGNKPVLWPESLAGALRSRARWLAEVARAKNPDGKRPPEIPMDDPKLETALGGAKRVRGEEDLSQLSSVERLFGVTGAKAQLTIKSVTCTQAGQRETIMSNSIDRLTGGTRGGVLYGRRSYWSPVFEVLLEIAEDSPCLDALLASLQTDGIELGHGASKGFGWFSVEVSHD